MGLVQSKQSWLVRCMVGFWNVVPSRYQVPESKLNMLGWQSALHKALTDKKNASVRRDNALLKVVWQWRAHGQALKMGKV